MPTLRDKTIEGAVATATATTSTTASASSTSVATYEPTVMVDVKTTTQEKSRFGSKEESSNPTENSEGEKEQEQFDILDVVRKRAIAMRTPESTTRVEAQQQQGPMTFHQTLPPTEDREGEKEQEQFDILDVVRKRAIAMRTPESTTRVEAQQQQQQGPMTFHQTLPPAEDREGEKDQEQEQFDIMDVVRKRAIAMRTPESTTRIEAGQDQQQQQQNPFLPIGSTPSKPKHQQHHGPAAFHQNVPLPENGEGEQQHQQQPFDIMEVVQKRAIMANEEEIDPSIQEEVLAPQPPPETIVASGCHDQAPSGPGAFAGSLGEGLHRRDNICFSLVGISPPGGEITADDDCSLDRLEGGAPRPSSGIVTSSVSTVLSVASLIFSDDDSSLMQAEEIDAEELERKAIDRKKKNKRLVLIGLALFLSALAVLFGATFGLSAKEQVELSPTAVPSMAPSESPSFAPSGALDFLWEGLPEHTLASLESFDTPQSKAMRWLENHPELLGMEESRKKQLFALVTFYYSMDGDNWPEEIKDKWLQYDDEECFWFSGRYGFIEDGQYEKEASYGDLGLGDPCNEQNEFQALILFELEGSPEERVVPREIDLMTSLTVLSLPRNHLNATFDDFLPPDIFALSNLTYLNLHTNTLTGSISTELGRMTNMVYLELGMNALTGPIPSEVGLMSNMTYLQLSANSLTGPIPTEVGRMASMENLALFENALTGALPSELGLMTSTTKLFLWMNSLNGSIPTEVGRMTNMSMLGFRANALTGPLPSELGTMTSMTQLALEKNTLSGSIPSELGGLTNMAGLALNQNALTGPLPSELGLMTCATTLRLFRNSLSDSIPTELGSMTSMINLGLSSNAFTGPVPSELGLMSSTTLLSLFSNSLSGSIPSELGRMTNMVELGLNQNALTGPLPSELGLLTSMTFLNLHTNNIAGSIPPEFGRMSDLTVMSLRMNSLSGTLPSKLSLLANLTVIKLNNNNLRGSMPAQLALMTNLEELWLHNNHLTGFIPSQLAGVLQLEQIRLENNAFTGTIPLELEYLRVNGSLTALALANNSFSGTIPEGLCSLGMFDSSLGMGLSFDCGDQLCGCCWCPCPGSNYSSECETRPFVPARDDKEWPGMFPFPANRSNAITINIRTNMFPAFLAFDWSVLTGHEAWAVLDSRTWELVKNDEDANRLHSRTYEVDSDAIYKLHLFDQYGSGFPFCCTYGFGWFAIANSIPSSDNAEGTVIWDAAGDVLVDSLDVFIWVDLNGHAHHVKYLPGEGYALIQDESSSEGQIIVLHESGVNDSIVELEIPEVDSANSTLVTKDERGAA